MRILKLGQKSADPFVVRDARHNDGPEGMAPGPLDDPRSNDDQNVHFEDLRRLGELTDDLLIVNDERGNVRYANGAASRLYGHPVEELIGRKLTDFITEGDGIEAHRRLVSEALATDNRAAGRIPTVGADGRIVELDVNTVRDPETGYWYTVERNVTDVVYQEQELQRLNGELMQAATRDTLTGLFNRRILNTELDDVLYKEIEFALVLLDMDDFKLVNDTIGHSSGDQLLRFAAERLSTISGPEDTLARFGNDEFFALLRNPVDEADVMARVGAMRERLSEPYVIAGRTVYVSCSAGVALCDGDRRTAGDMIRHTEMAVAKAKEQGRGGCVLFDRSIRDEVRDRYNTETELRRGLAAGQIEVALQGIFGATDRKLLGFEALARWRHPYRGLVFPDEFIDIAEHCGLLDDVTVAVLTNSLSAVGEWLQGEGRTLSINFSPLQLRAVNMPDRLLDVLTAFEVEPNRIVIEITEVGLTGALQAAMPNLHRLRAAGFHLAIDDFGKGASSLGYLRDVPLTSVKIDGSFIHNLADDEFAATITSSVIDLATRLGLSAVAECVETEEQLARLVEMGCHRVQGYLLHRPCPAEEATALTRSLDPTTSSEADRSGIDQTTGNHEDDTVTAM